MVLRIFLGLIFMNPIATINKKQILIKIQKSMASINSKLQTKQIKVWKIYRKYYANNILIPTHNMGIKNKHKQFIPIVLIAGSLSYFNSEENNQLDRSLGLKW